MNNETVVERAGRWLAARLSRRTFLGRLGQAGVLIAGGPVLVTFLADRAEARVCGQSGVAPKCPTFDCTGPDDVWGWCWYASPGCCAGGGLKKICDCCRRNHPFVHGYCPSGYNVYCIVESCHADPRVQPVGLDVIRAERSATAAARLTQRRWSGGAREAVIGDARDPLSAAVAGAAAGALGLPLLLADGEGLPAITVHTLQRLGVTSTRVAGPALPSGVDDELAAYGWNPSRLGTSGERGEWSKQVAESVMAARGTRRAFCVEVTGASADAAAAAGAAGATLGYPLVIGASAAVALGNGSPRSDVTYMVGPEAAIRAGDVPGGHALWGDSRAVLGRQIGDVVFGIERARARAAILVPDGHTSAAIGLVQAGGVMLFHPLRQLDDANAAWIRANQPFIARGYAGGMSGLLDDEGIWKLQSSLNHFDVHRLMGVPGEGLPVISQPHSERELGQARVAGAPEDDDDTYWMSRANPARH